MNNFSSIQGLPVITSDHAVVKLNRQGGILTLENGLTYRLKCIRINGKMEAITDLNEQALQKVANLIEKLVQQKLINLEEDLRDLKSIKINYQPKAKQVASSLVIGSRQLKQVLRQERDQEPFNQLTHCCTQFMQSLNPVHPQPQSDLSAERDWVWINKGYGDIGEVFRYKEKEYGEQAIKTVPVVSDDIEYCQKAIEVLERKRTVVAETDQSKLAQIQEQITYYENKIANISEYTSKTNEEWWVGANYFRFLVNKLSSYAKAVEAYTAIPVNMRWQTCKENKTQTDMGFYRLGVITDLSNGWINLKWLKDLESLPLKQYHEELEGKIEEIKQIIAGIENQGIKKIFRKYSKKPLKGLKLESAEHALRQLELIQQKPGSLPSLILERRLRLRDQFVHLLARQMEKHEQEQETDGRVFELAHIALLNPTKSKLDETGWMHDEYNELMDMYEIFKEFNGYKIQLSETVPYVDPDQQIVYLPRHHPANEGKKLKLKTYFFNISVQGQKNEGVQERINSENLQDLAQARGWESGSLPKDVQDLRERLIKKESNHDVAEDFMLALHNHSRSVAVSLGCVSAKDRTKVVVEDVRCKFFSQVWNKPKHQAAMETFRDQAWSDKNNASNLVIEDNNPGVRAAKFNPGWIKAKISRIAKAYFAWQTIYTHVLKPLLVKSGGGAD